MSDEALTLALRVIGASHIALALAHVVLWRLFDWSREITKLTPLTARVFAVHTFFIAFVLAALGALGLGRADLLLTRSDLARWLLWGIVIFCGLRALAQPFVFDPVMLRGSRLRGPVRIAALLLFSTYTAAYALALAKQS
jgi:hypothetical protein